jgi:hypothetical protein
VDHLTGSSVSRPAGRQEERYHGGSIASGVRGVETFDQGGLEREEDARAVARFAVGRERPAMPKRAESGERERQDAVAASTAGVRDEPDTARVVLEGAVVERRRTGPSVAASTGGVCHGDGPPVTEHRGRRGHPRWKVAVGG